jgi:putative ABC transport system permease protein
MEAYRDLVWGMRYLLAPAVLVTMALVISNAISISVRERQTEFAVLKVLGFRPWHILNMVLAEALLIGALSGLISASATYFVINHVLGGIRFPIAFFGAFFIPKMALVWGLLVGGGTALVGTFVPAWTACRVRVTEVFARVA